MLLFSSNIQQKLYTKIQILQAISVIWAKITFDFAIHFQKVI